MPHWRSLTATLACGLLLGAGCALPAQAAYPDVQAGVRALDACASHLDPDLDVGYARVAARCPELTTALTAAGIERWLPQGWSDANNDLSAGSLTELRTLLVREAALRPLGRSPRLEALHGVLTQLGPSGQARSGLWSRVHEWLRHLTLRRSDAQGPGWLSRLVSRIGWSQTLARALVYAALAGVIALALAILAHEVRASGAWRAWRGRRVTAVTRTALLRDRALSWSDVERARLAERPALLLTLILQRLGGTPEYTGLASLTVRELLARLSWPEPRETQQLASLALTAERVRYGSQATADTELCDVLAGGRALLERLETEPLEPRPLEAGRP